MTTLRSTLESREGPGGSFEAKRLRCTRCGAASVTVLVGTDDPYLFLDGEARRVLLRALDEAARLDFAARAQGNGCDHGRPAEGTVSDG